MADEIPNTPEIKLFQQNLPLQIVKLMNSGQPEQARDLIKGLVANEIDPQQKAGLLHHLIGVCAIVGGEAQEEIPHYLNDIIRLSGFSDEEAHRIREVLGPIMDPVRIKQETTVVFQKVPPEVKRRIGPPNIYYRSFKFSKEPDSEGWFRIEGRDSLRGKGGVELLLQTLFGSYYAKIGRITQFVKETAGRSILNHRNVKDFAIDPSSGRFSVLIRPDGNPEDLKSIVPPDKMEREIIDETETGFMFRYEINPNDRSLVIKEVALVVESLNEHEVGMDLIEQNAVVDYIKTSVAQCLNCGIGHSHPWPSFFSLHRSGNSEGIVTGDFDLIFYTPGRFRDGMATPLPNTTTACLVLIHYNKGFLYVPNQGITIANIKI